MKHDKYIGGVFDFVIIDQNKRADFELGWKEDANVDSGENMNDDTHAVGNEIQLMIEVGILLKWNHNCNYAFEGWHFNVVWWRLNAGIRINCDVVCL